MSPGELFAFGPFQLDSRTRRLQRDGEVVPLSSRQFDLLHLLVSRAGQLLSKDQLIAVAWPDVAVTDNSLEQAISTLRRTLTPHAGQPYIETQARRGYRFSAEVTRLEHRETDQALDALLMPHRAWLEGRAALETLERDQIRHARAVFEKVVAEVPGQASAHVGLANACVMQFEMTRTDSGPDVEALALAQHHAREACRLDAGYGEGWATLGFVLDRSGNATDALAACRHAVSLEPDNWRHRFRLAYVSWGEERLREARRTLALLPAFPLAHWLAATVHIARQAMPEAERELTAGIAAQESQRDGRPRFSAVALHWLLGLIALAQGDEERAVAEFTRELGNEVSGQLYARECCANTWYAIGALKLRRGDKKEAAHAFQEALRRLPIHPLALVGLNALGEVAGQGKLSPLLEMKGELASHKGLAMEIAMAKAAALVLGRRSDQAAALLDRTLAEAAPGNAGWLLPIEPLLHASAEPGPWQPVLARLRNRAA